MNSEQIEDAIKARIIDQLNYVRTVETYAGQLEGEIEKLAINYPAVFISYGGSELTWLDDINYQEDVEFMLLCCAKNLKGEAAARKDDQGCYQMIIDARAALTNQTFNLDMQKLQPTRVEQIYIGKTIAIYGVRFKTSFDNQYA